MGKALIIKGADFSNNAVELFPSGYQRVMSIRAAMPYMAATGVFITDSKYKIQWAGRYYQQTMDYQSLFADYENETTRVARVLHGQINSNDMLCNYNIPAANPTSQLFRNWKIVGARHTVELTYDRCVYDSTIVPIQNPVTSDVTKTISLKLNTYGYDVEKFIIYHSGVKVINYIPCRRLSDDAVGFYDTVAGEFIEVDSSYNPVVTEL